LLLSAQGIISVQTERVGAKKLAIRISGGVLRGRKIGSPGSGSGIRPTTDRVKLAIFSVIRLEAVEKKRVLDLYACSGALGIEALSRGAATVEFVEKSARNCKLIQANVSKVGLERVSKVVKSDCVRFVAGSKGGYGLVMLDPPFDMNDWEAMMGMIGGKGFVEQFGMVVAEHRTGVCLRDCYGQINRFSLKDYGDSQVSFYEVVGG